MGGTIEKWGGTSKKFRPALGAGILPPHLQIASDATGDDNWSYKTCKAAVKSSPPTNQHLTFYRPDVIPVAQPTVSKHWRGNITFRQLAYPELSRGLPTLSLTTNSSWLPWGKVAMSLISPLMPVPPIECEREDKNVRTFRSIVEECAWIMLLNVLMFLSSESYSFNALTLLVEWQEGHQILACKVAVSISSSFGDCNET